MATADKLRGAVRLIRLAISGGPMPADPDACPSCSQEFGSPSPCAITHDFGPGAYGPPRPRVSRLVGTPEPLSCYDDRGQYVGGIWPSSTPGEEGLYRWSANRPFRPSASAEKGVPRAEAEQALYAALGEWADLEPAPKDPGDVTHWRDPDMVIACNEQKPNEGATDNPRHITCPKCRDVHAERELLSKLQPW